MNKLFSKKLSSIFLSIIFVVLIFCFSVLISKANVAYAYETDGGSLLTGKRYVDIGAGETKKFTTDLSPKNMYWVIETRGTLDTYITLQVGNRLYEDDNSGVGENACIGFLWDAPLTIKVKCKNSNESGRTQLQLRNQQASLFGFDYGSGDINTKKDLSKPDEYLSEYYNTLSFTDPSIFTDHIFLGGPEIIGYSRLNSEIFFFSGHGSKSGAVIYPTNNWFYVNQINNMENCKLAVWSACYSANSNNAYKKSIAEASVIAGARTSIGWEETIPELSARTFTNRLFKKLSEGESVENACKYAKNGIVLVWDNARNYTIFGDKTTKINASSIKKSIKNSINVKNPIVNEIINNDKEWTGFEYENNVFRFYKIINGLISNIFYDINVNTGQIVYKSNIDIEYNNLKVLELNNNGTAMVKCLNHNILNIETYSIYCVIDNVAVPVEITYFEYEKNGCNYMDVVCTNLNNGESMDYSDICEVKE